MDPSRKHQFVSTNPSIFSLEQSYTNGLYSVISDDLLYEIDLGWKGDGDEAWGEDEGCLFVANDNATDSDIKYVQLLNFVVVFALGFVVIQ